MSLNLMAKQDNAATPIPSTAATPTPTATDSTLIPASGKGKPTRGIAFAQGPGYTWWVMREDGEVRCVPQGDLILGENSQ